MKHIRKFLSLVVVFVILHASSFPVSAMEFDPETVYDSVLVVLSGNAIGSGYAVGENCVVTNAHVIDDPEDLFVSDYSGNIVRAGIVGISREQDLAVLSVEESQFEALSSLKDGKIKPGDDVFAIGAPKSMTYTLTKGVISARNRMIGDQSYIQIDAAVNEGNSGGPVLNQDGKVLGMTTLKILDSEGIGLAIPSARILDFLHSLHIETDEDGKVVGKVTAAGFEEAPDGLKKQEPEKDRLPQEKKDRDGENRAETTEDSNAGLLWIVGISITANVVLTIMLVYEKRRQAIAAEKLRENTDFEIDFWE